MVRDAVRWVRNSPAKLKKFRDFVDLIGVEAKSALHLDIPTRWNNTYIMLNTAIQYQKVFEAYEENDASFSSDLAEFLPSYLDWCSVQSLIILLKSFYEIIFVLLYGEEKCKSCFANVQAAMVELYNDYASTYYVSSLQSESSTQSTIDFLFSPKWLEMFLQFLYTQLPLKSYSLELLLLSQH
ncbi:PREDICTED: zinc finger BED domain-containing protein RICESLEEPER 2-like [Ipomoea nil]|uniref:zinc finger BED domain-containing protein RICESLEEPER 2-like n=1 Tax=Ipomoea nil TaxID=35883 RepID=UPI0009009500|nr:PREDICTED: zinc finger BED domain-containing protein RICESLEEPER 2-like [Ipomoea nil]